MCFMGKPRNEMIFSFKDQTVQFSSDSLSCLTLCPHGLHAAYQALETIRLLETISLTHPRERRGSASLWKAS